MLDSQAAPLEGVARRGETRTGSIAGNARLTGAVAVALLVLLAAEGVTIPFIGQLLGPHIFIGLLLVPPVALKIGRRTGYRFARYYTHDEPYRPQGAAADLCCACSHPGIILTTLAVFGTGIALLFTGPPSNTLIFAHKLSFIAWVALMTLPCSATCSSCRSWRAPTGGAAAARSAPCRAPDAAGGAGGGDRRRHRARRLALSIGKPWL